ncbi:MAG: hypothetical protein ACKVOR_12775 [Flavobacteriales bacterium]
MKKLLLLTTVCLSLFACREKNKIDVSAPLITSVTVNDSSASLHIIDAPALHTIAMMVTDNMGLNEAKLTVQAVNFSNPNATYGPNTGEFESITILNLDGTSATQSLNLDIPDSIGGHWQLTVEVSDEVGYLATPYTTILRIENENLPAITAATTPAISSAVVSMSEGQNLAVDGTVFDEDSLDFVQVRVESLAGDVLSSIDIPFDDTGVSFTPTFDDMQAGHYMLVIEGRDKLGYRKIWGVHVIVNA